MILQTKKKKGKRMFDVVDLDLDCEEICEKVFRNQDKWIDRDIFYTFGASSYIDDNNEYNANLEKSNSVLFNCFSDLYKKLEIHFGATLNKEIAYPGFHIFDERCHNIDGSIHFDSSYLRLPIYKKSFSNPQSFTILLKKPSTGAGLNVWDKIDLKRIPPSKREQYIKNIQKIGEPTYMEYELGKMYVHSGEVLHQIANTGGLMGDSRVTLQGHVIQDGDKKYLFF